MSNALINKYRPKTFKQVIGQDAVVRALQKIVADDSSHCFLFSGPSGTGKTTLARIVAQEIGCEPRDIQEHDAATYTGIDNMRDLMASLSYRPVGGGKARAVILNEVQGLSKQAWDAALTKMEEPPPWLYFFMTTTVLAKVPEAAKTRASKFDLKPVHLGELEKLLCDIAKAEDMPCDDAIARLCAKHAQGSPRAGISALGACASARSKEEALALLKSAEESPQAIDLARALMASAGWPQIKEILEGLKDENPESVRHVVRAYMTVVIMGAKKEPPGNALAVLKAFSQPFPSGDGISPLVLAICEMMFSE